MPTAALRLTRHNDLFFANPAWLLAPPLSFHGECLFQNPGSRLGQLVFRQLLLARESNIGYIASRHGVTRNAFTQIVSDHIMESWTPLSLVRPRGALQVNSVEDFDKLDHAYRETGFFQQFARYALLQRHAQLQLSSWNRPFPKQRLASVSNQQRAPLFDNHSTHSDHRSFLIFQNRRHLEVLNLFLGGVQIRRFA